jgi:D-aspartate ligase
MPRPPLDFDASVPVLLVKIGHYPLHHGSVGAIRSLGRVGVPVYAITEDRYTPPAVSRYLRRSFVWPTTGLEPEADLHSGLRAVTEQIGTRAVALATDDEAAVLLAEHPDLRDALIMPEVAGPLPRVLASKRGLHDLCEMAGAPTPEAWFPISRDEAIACADEVRFPVVVKNVEPWARLLRPAVRSSTLVHGADELVALAQHWPDAPNVMLQEYVPADVAEDWIFHMYCDANSDCLVAFTGVKLRNWPPRGGVTAFARVVRNDTVAELSESLCRQIGYRGIGDLDWRFDRRDGRYKLLDFNPRPGAQFRLFETAAGIDVVRALHLDLTGRPVPRSPQVEGRRFVTENLWAASMVFPSHRAALEPVLPPARVRVEFGWWALDDPLPFVAMAIRFTGDVAGRLVRALPRVLQSAIQRRSLSAAKAALTRRAAKAVPATNLIRGPKVAAADNPVKNSPSTEDSNERVSDGHPATRRT